MAVHTISAGQLRRLVLAACLVCGGCQLAPQSDPAPVGVTQTMSAALKSAGNRLGQLLEVPQQVTPASDPASLDSLPPRLDAAFYVQFAHTAEQQGHLAAAKRYFEQAVELEPANVPALVAFARFCDRHQLRETALATYHQAREADPAVALVPNDVGLLYARYGRFPEALQYLQQAVALQPESVRYRNNLAQVLIAADQTSAAVEALLPVLPPAAAHYNVACLLQEQGRAPDSFQHLTRAVELDPAYRPALEMLARSQAQTSVASAAGQPQRR